MEKPMPGVVYRAQMTDRCPIRVASIQEKGWGIPPGAREVPSGTCVLLLEVATSEVHENSHACKCLLSDGTVGWIELYKNRLFYWDDNPVSVWLEKVER